MPAPSRQSRRPDPARAADAPPGTRRSARADAFARHAERFPRPLAAGRVRVGILTAALVVAAAVVYLVFLRGVNSNRGTTSIPWPAFALGFFLVEVKVVEVYFRREHHSFSLSEVPAVLGLFYLSPPEYLVALVVGSGLALVVATEQSPLKIVFNLANNVFIGALTLVIFNALADAGSIPGAADWIALLVTMVVASAVGAVTIATAITASGGAPQFKKLPEMVKFGAVVAVANTSLALLTLMAAWTDPQAIILVVIPVTILFMAYRAYDGRFGPSVVVIGTEPGAWRPAPPAFAVDPASWVANVKPFLLPRGDLFRSDGPNALTSAAYAADFAEVKSLGSATSTTRTADETDADRGRCRRRTRVSVAGFAAGQALTGLYAHRQPVLARRQRAGVLGGIRAVGVIGLVEVQHVAAVGLRLQVEVAAGAVCLGAARCVEEGDEQRVVMPARQVVGGKGVDDRIELEVQRSDASGRPQLPIRRRDLER